MLRREYIPFLFYVCERVPILVNVGAWVGSEIETLGGAFLYGSLSINIPHQIKALET